jgi:tetratricopeptide (TPR) repeat protein
LDLLQPALAEEMAVRDRVMLLNNDVIIRASRGETVDGGIAEVASLAAGMSGPDATAVVADPTANAALAAGNLQKAHDEFLQIADDDISMAPEYLYRAAHPALWLRDRAAAVALLARLEEVGGGGPTPDARLATVRAGIAALEGKTVEAMALYREALRGWRETNSVWEEVQTGLDMAELLDRDEPEVASVVASTRAILERLGAKPYLARLDALARANKPTVAAEARPAQAAETELGVAAINP